MTVVALLGGLILIGLMTYTGWRDGAFAGLYSLLRNLLAFLFAMTLFKPAAELLQFVFPGRHPWPAYLDAFSVAAIYALVVGAIRWAKMRYTAPGVHTFNAVDRIVGPICALAAGVILSGFLLILWSMMPFAKHLPYDLGRVNNNALPADTGSATLRFYGFLYDKVPGRRMFLLHDEKLVADVNKNGRFDTGLGEQFEDLNKNGRWDRGWLWRYRHGADFTPEDLDAVTPADARKEESAEGGGVP